MTVGLPECHPLMQVARRRPDLPLASPPSGRASIVERVFFGVAIKGKFMSARQGWIERWSAAVMLSETED